ncbi:hypothetical protein Tsubulata_024636 [Turnera subulata]|uniref:FHA domain-containing protein n=1 Tax=Turnera subulata TaxID=218843 RepID=A0A9Q0FXU5_9ROSI|nr:hypothetical protein Tsubulata_024636 [Turnera subulata]
MSCDVIVTKDKGVSRIHAYIVVDDMSSWSSRQTSSYLHSRVQIRDCSKYGTFINKNTVSKELKTGTWFHLELVVLHTGAHITYHFSEECTHVLVDDFMPVGEAVIDAVVAKKPIVLWSWVELIAEQGIGKEIPSWSSYMPTLTFEGVPVKIGDLTTRAKCLEGYTCLLQSIDEYKFRSTLQSLLEVGGAKILFIEELCSSGQGLGYGESSRLLGVIPSGSGDKFGCFSKVGSLYRVNELTHSGCSLDLKLH